MKANILKHTAILLLFAVSFSSCEKEKGEEVPFIEIWKDVGLCKESYDKQDILISCNDEWETFLMDIDYGRCCWYADGTPCLSKIENDFYVYQIIVAIDSYSTYCAGMNFEITKITEYPEKVIVIVTETEPKGKWRMCYELHQTCHIVKIPVTEKRIEFKHKNVKK